MFEHLLRWNLAKILLLSMICLHLWGSPSCTWCRYNIPCNIVDSCRGLHFWFGALSKCWWTYMPWIRTILYNLRTLLWTETMMPINICDINYVKKCSRLDIWKWNVSMILLKSMTKVTIHPYKHDCLLDIFSRKWRGIWIVSKYQYWTASINLVHFSS